MEDYGNFYLWFGKYRGYVLGQIPRSYIEWLARNATGMPDAMEAAQRYLGIEVHRNYIPEPPLKEIVIRLPEDISVEEAITEPVEMTLACKWCGEVWSDAYTLIGCPECGCIASEKMTKEKTQDINNLYIIAKAKRIVAV